MLSEFNLSEKIEDLFKIEYLDTMADVQGDVSVIFKEFIQRLKEEIVKEQFKTFKEWKIDKNVQVDETAKTNFIINKLAGDKLV